MGDLRWSIRHRFTFPLATLHHHVVCLGATGSGKTETLLRIAYGACKVYGMQVIFLDAKGEAKSVAHYQEDMAARFIAAMRLAGAAKVKLFPATSYNGWLGTPTDLIDRLLSVIDLSESAYYRDVATNIVQLALRTPVTPRNSSQFLANLRPEQLELAYKDHTRALERVRRLDRRLLQEVRMRYEVFFGAVRGQLDGTLNLAEVDAAFLRVQGFALRQEASRLGRFLIQDFTHYISARRPGVQTLLIIDEFGALELRSEMSILFEQVRSFGGSLVIAAQGYAGLGPAEHASRILDATNTYILHQCSDPFPVAKRAGKRTLLDTSWSEEQDRTFVGRKHVRTRWEWRVPANAVMQQEPGQAYWINRGKAQQVLTARVPVTDQQVHDAWQEIRREEEQRRQVIERTQAHQQAATSQATVAAPPPLPQPTPQENQPHGQKRSK